MPGDSKTCTMYNYCIELASAITTLRDVFQSLKNLRNDEQLQNFLAGDITLIEKI